MTEDSKRHQSLWSRILQGLRWLTPGLGIKRWVIMTVSGAILLGLGIGGLILDLSPASQGTLWKPLLSLIALRFLPLPVRTLVTTGLGFVLILFGITGANRSILKPFMDSGFPVLDTISAYRKKERGPRIVTIGGGTGLANLLRGLKEYTSNLTAIVTVADDGGSSGELRRTIGILPPGDIRNCLTALSNDERLLTQIFQYRFAAGAGINGHNLGNLFITALAEITGSFEEAVAESGRVLAVQGQVLPATLHDVKLVASVAQSDHSREVMVRGESQIPKANGKIDRVWLEPNSPLAFPPTIQAILSADLIIVGPGSLYTSIIPNLLVPDIVEAIRSSRALKFYICNVATQRGETDGFTCADHARTIENHAGVRIFDLVICNNQFDGHLSQGVDWVRDDGSLEKDFVVYSSKLAEKENPWRHDSEKTAKVVMDLLYERTGPMLFREDGLI